MNRFSSYPATFDRDDDARPIITDEELDEDLDEDPTADEAPEPESPNPDDPLTGWELFAASRLEWGEAWSTSLHWVYGAYASWCGSYGKRLLPDADVLTWLQARGARLTGAGSSGQWLQGLRVVD